MSDLQAILEKLECLENQETVSGSNSKRNGDAELPAISKTTRNEYAPLSLEWLGSKVSGFLSGISSPLLYRVLSHLL